MISRLVPSLLLFVFLTSAATNAFPDGAGDCPGGEEAVGASHQRADSGTAITGSLADGGLEFTIDSIPLSAGKMTLIAGQTYEVVLATTREPFRGFLIRLGGGSNDLDTSDALQVPPSQLEDMQVSEKCVEEYAVGGVTHTNRDPQNFTTAELYVEEESFDMPVDVTVVIKNRGPESEYYYSSFLVDVVAEGGAVLTAAPTDPSTTMDPSSSGTMDPSSDGSFLDSGAPTPAPTESQTSWTYSPTESMESTTLPPPDDTVGYCGDSWSFGVLQAGECYAADLGSCTFYSESQNCRETSTFMTYYNAMWSDDEWSFANRQTYGTVSVSTDNCNGADICEVKVGDVKCQASCDGEDGMVTVESCHGLPQDSMQFEYFPQVIHAEHGMFDMISTTEMCEHPSVVQQEQQSVQRSGPDPSQAKKSGATNTMTIPTELRIGFDNDALDLNLDVPTRTQFLTQTMEYFRDRLVAKANFDENTILDVRVDQIRLTVLSEDEINLAFDAKVVFDGAAKATMREVLTQLSTSDWGGYAQSYNGDEESILSRIRRIAYKGIGRGGLDLSR